MLSLRFRNLNKINVLPRLYHLGLSISNIRIVGWLFYYYSNFDRRLCSPTVKNLIRRRIMRRLIMVCTDCLSSHKKDARQIYGLNHFKHERFCNNTLCGLQGINVFYKCYRKQLAENKFAYFNLSRDFARFNHNTALPDWD